MSILSKFPGSSLFLLWCAGVSCSLQIPAEDEVFAPSRTEASGASGGVQASRHVSGGSAGTSTNWATASAGRSIGESGTTASTFGNPSGGTSWASGGLPLATLSGSATLGGQSPTAIGAGGQTGGAPAIGGSRSAEVLGGGSTTGGQAGISTNIGGEGGKGGGTNDPRRPRGGGNGAGGASSGSSGSSSSSSGRGGSSGTSSSTTIGTGGTTNDASAGANGTGGAPGLGGSASTSSLNLEDGLVAHFAFEESTGTIATNSVDTSKSGSYVGSCTHPTGRLGKAVGIRNLNGVSSDWVELPPGLLSGLAATTVSLWVRDLSTARKGGRLFHFSLGTTEEIFFAPDDSNPATSLDGAHLGATHAGTAFVDLWSATPVLTDKEWHYIALTWSAASIDLYIDGSPSDSLANPGVLPNELGPTSPNWLGRTLNDASIALYAEIDDLRIYNRVLTTNEIARLYTLL